MRIFPFASSLLVGASASLPALARPPHHHYDDSDASGYLIPGFGISRVSNDASTSTAIGAELAYSYCFSSNLPEAGFGPYAQADVLIGEDSSHFAGGLRAGKYFGFDLGYAYRGHLRAQPGFTAVEVGVFLGLGSHLALGGRVSLPLTSAAQQTFGNETAFTLTLKAPGLIHGREPSRGPGWPAFHWMGGG